MIQNHKAHQLTAQNAYLEEREEKKAIHTFGRSGAHPPWYNGQKNSTYTTVLEKEIRKSRPSPNDKK
jgi:hypothetical protein